MNAIEIKNICKNYKDVKAVNNVSFNIEEGALFGLLGTNGAGKTTIIKMISGLTKPSSGDALVYGYSIINDLQNVKTIVDVSPQETSVAPNLTVKENLFFFAGVYLLENGTAKERIDSIIEVFDLSEVLDKKAKTLSGGWQRRLSIALAMVSSPKVLFLDEPTLGLDVLARRELWRIINRLKGKVTIVLTSHYLEEIEALCDKVAIMNKGKILEIGTVTKIKDNAGTDNFEDAFVTIVEGDISNEKRI